MKPYAHQTEALRQAKDKRAFAYFLEMGLGKSKVLIDEMMQLYIDKRIDRAIIFAGKGSYSDWVYKHLPEHMPTTFPYVAHLWAGGKSKREVMQLKLFMNAPGLHILIMNTESVAASQKANTVAYNFVTGGHTLLCVDESTMVKNYQANRTTTITDLGRRSVVKRIMTGSAITQSPLDLWGQFSVLGIQRLLGDNWFSFRAQYCHMVDINVNVPDRSNPGNMRQQKVKKITGYKNLDQLESVIKGHSFRVLKKDCLDLPPKIYEKIDVELTPEQASHYTSMVMLAMSEIKRGIWANASTALTKLMRLHQIVCGHIRDEDGTLHRIKTNRMLALDQVIEETTGKIVIWAAHRADTAQVMEHLAKTYPDEVAVRYDGTVSPPDRANALNAFQHGEAKFFVGTAATGGFGITLTACSNVIYFSNTFKLEQRMQSEDRCHRIGQHNSVVYVDLVAKDTVEEKIIQALRDKKDIADLIMDGAVTKWLNW